MNPKAKEYQKSLQKKENEILRNTMLYCANEGIEFTRQHNILIRNAMRQFFKEGVYPIVREMYDNPEKNYADK